MATCKRPCISAQKNELPAAQVNSFVALMCYYNMVGVVVAMVISTMHEKSCIDSHNAREFEKSSRIQSFTYLAITMMKLRKYHSHEFLKLSKLYNAIIQKVMSYKTEQEFLFELSLISLKTINTRFSKRTIRIMSHLKIFASIICVDLVTPESLWRHKGVAMHVTYKTMHRFSTMHDSPPPASEFRLQVSAS